jgi:glycosyltransferase involved in cell wall biosynthesis
MTTSSFGKTKKISVCITVFNEQFSVSRLIESLISQKNYFLELIICDGGSSDNTPKIIKSYQKKHKWISLIESIGNVAHGRNVAIKKAKGKIIVTTDAGCVAHKDWIEKLVNPLKNNLCDITAGFYLMKTKNSFQKALSIYRGVTVKNYDNKTFMPSCRSVGFSKKVWQDVGGFDESLTLSGEDTKFFYSALEKGFKIKRVKNALVDWVEPEHFGFKDFKKFYSYAKGDAQTGIWWHPIQKWRTHNIKILTIFARYILLLWALYFVPPVGFILILTYSVWIFMKVYIQTNDFKSGLWGILVQYITDCFISCGFIIGNLTTKAVQAKY